MRSAVVVITSSLHSQTTVVDGGAKGSGVPGPTDSDIFDHIEQNTQNLALPWEVLDDGLGLLRMLLFHSANGYRAATAAHDG